MCGDGDGDGFGCEDSEGDGNQVIMRAGMKIRRGFDEECVCVCRRKGRTGMRRSGMVGKTDVEIAEMSDSF